MRSKTLLAWQSVLAGLQVMAGAAAMADVLGERWFGLFVVGLGALQVGTATWVHGLVTPTPVADPPQVEVVVPEPRLPRHRE